MKVERVVLASRNRGKIAELGRLLEGQKIAILGLDDFPEIGEIEETGATFVENALIKAHTVAEKTGLVAIADDSGIVVDALAGAPGVFSARYGDDWKGYPGESRDQRNMRKLLHFMRNVPDDRRSCHFETVIAAASPGGSDLVAKGEWQGQLLHAPLGNNGFGYDPVFWDSTLEKSAAQLSQAEKNMVSHRGAALRMMLKQWPKFLKKISEE